MNENNLDEGSADQGEALHDSVRDLVSSAPIFTPIPHLRKNCWIQNSALIFLFLPATLSSSALQFDFGAFFMDSRFLLTADCRARPAAFTPFHLLNLTLFLEKASRVVSLREVRGSQARSSSLVWLTESGSLDRNTTMQLRERIGELESMVSHLQDENQRLHAHLDVFLQQLQTSGAPLPPPPPMPTPGYYLPPAGPRYGPPQPTIHQRPTSHAPGHESHLSHGHPHGPYGHPQGEHEEHQPRSSAPLYAPSRFERIASQHQSTLQQEGALYAYSQAAYHDYPPPSDSVRITHILLVALTEQSTNSPSPLPLLPTAHCYGETTSAFVSPTRPAPAIASRSQSADSEHSPSSSSS